MEAFETILERMKESYRELSGVPAQDATDIGIRLKIMAGEIHALQAYLAYIERQAFPDTAVGEGLEHHAAQRGLSRRLAEPAKGILTFSRGEALDYDVDIPKGVVCTTAGASPLEFVTTESCILKAGKLSTTAAAEAVVPGQGSNAAEDTVCVLSTIPTGIESVTNTEAFTGGRDKENDDALRARVLACWGFSPSGSNAEFYRRCALACPGVGSASAIPREDGAGTVGVYIRGIDAAADEATLKAVQQELSDKREINVTVTVKHAQEMKKNVDVYVVPVAGCTQEAAQQAAEEAVRRYFTTLRIGDPFMLIQVGQYLLNTGYIANYDFAISTTDGASVQGGIYVPGNIWAGELV